MRPPPIPPLYLLYRTVKWKYSAIFLPLKGCVKEAWFSPQVFSVFTQLQCFVCLIHESSWTYCPLFSKSVFSLLSTHIQNNMMLVKGKKRITAESRKVQNSLHKTERKKEKEWAEWWGACWLNVSYQRLSPDGLQTHLLFILFLALCCPSSPSLSLSLNIDRCVPLPGPPSSTSFPLSVVSSHFQTWNLVWPPQYFASP